MALSLPLNRYLLHVVNEARTAVYQTRNLDEGQRINPLYDEEEDEAHDRPFVELVIGWNLDKTRQELHHIEGDELRDLTRPGYMGHYHVRLRIPQVKDVYSVPAGDTEDLVEWIRCDFNRQLEGGKTGGLYRPRPRKDRPKILQPKDPGQSEVDDWDCVRASGKKAMLPSKQMLLYRIWRARVAVVGDPQRIVPLYDAGLDEEGHPIPYVWLGVGWDPDKPHTRASHCRYRVWGAEGLDPEDLIHTCPVSVMTRIPQVATLEWITEADGGPILQEIRGGLVRELAEQNASNQTSV